MMNKILNAAPYLAGAAIIWNIGWSTYELFISKSEGYLSAICGWFVAFIWFSIYFLQKKTYDMRIKNKNEIIEGYSKFIDEQIKRREEFFKDNNRHII